MDELEKLRKENENLRKKIGEFESLRANLKKGMVKKARLGRIMSRAPFGYIIENKKLKPSIHYKEVGEIFEEFLNENLSLRKVAEKHKLSVNGLKKILRNFTYIGKIKFDNEIHDAKHQPIISSSLFNHVQNRLEKLDIK